MFSLVVLEAEDVHCTRCKEPLAKSQLVISRSFYGEITLSNAAWLSVPYYHPQCALDISPEATRDALRMNETKFEGREELYALTVTRMVAKLKLIDARRAAKKKGTTAEIPAIEPARDRFGRPRVRVYWAGSFVSAGADANEAFAKLAPDSTLASALREYELLPFVKVTKKSLDDDPSQPLIGAVYATISSVRLASSQKEKLVAWKAENIPTPLIWVLDAAREPALVDARVLELRAAMDAAGYVGDEAHVVVTHSMDQDAITAVGRAMDEALGFAELREQTADPGKRAAERLRELVTNNDREGLVPALEIAAKCLRGTHVHVKAQLAEDASKCLSFLPALVPALWLLHAVRALPAATRNQVAPLVGDVVLRALNAPGSSRTYPPEFAIAIEALEHWEYAARFDLLLTAYMAPKLTDNRRLKLQEYLAKCDDEAIAAKIRAWSEALGEKENARKITAGWLLESIDKCCEASRAAKKKEADARAKKSATKAAPKPTAGPKIVPKSELN